MNYIFLHAYHGTPYKQVLESLSKVPGTHTCRSETTYQHPVDLLRLKGRDKWAIRFVDAILENKEVQSKAVEDHVINIFLLGGRCENEDYLRFRLRRMYEIWRRNCGILLAPGVDAWNELEDVFKKRIEKVELPPLCPIGNKYLEKFKLHMTWQRKSTQT